MLLLYVVLANDASIWEIQTRNKEENMDKAEILWT